MHIWKKILLSCILMIVPITSMNVFALSFKNDFAGPLLQWDNKAFTIDGVTDDGNLSDNLKSIFYPWEWGQLWTLIRNIAVAIFFLFLVFAGIRFLIWAPDSEEELKSAKMNLLYIMYGAVLVFATTWLLWSAGLWLESLEWVVSDGSWTGNSIMERLENNVMLTILAFLKWAAFFIALLFLVYYGYNMIRAFDEEEKLKAARTGILNVFLALVFIKIVDYVFFIVQVQDFKSRAVELIVQISKFLWYIGGIMFVIAIMYTWFLMLTAKWDDDNIEKAKTMIKTIFTIVLIVLLFMLVIYQVFNDLL